VWSSSNRGLVLFNGHFSHLKRVRISWGFEDSSYSRNSSQTDPTPTPLPFFEGLSHPWQRKKRWAFTIGPRKKRGFCGRSRHYLLKSGFRIHAQNFIMENLCTSDYFYSGSRSSSSHRRKWSHTPSELIADCRRAMRTAWSLPRSKQTPSHPSMFADFTFTNRGPAKKTAKDFKSNAKIKSTYLERHLSLE